MYEHVVAHPGLGHVAEVDALLDAGEVHLPRAQDGIVAFDGQNSAGDRETHGNSF